jgi:hypothetical protein
LLRQQRAAEPQSFDDDHVFTFHFMHALRICGYAVVGALIIAPTLVYAQSSTPACPSAAVDTSGWVTATDFSVGVQLKHPADYREKHWESRSDTTDVNLAFWRNAVSTIEFHKPDAFGARRVPPSAAPCILEMPTGTMPLYFGRQETVLYSGQRALYYTATGLLAVIGKPLLHVELDAPDSTGLMEQLAILQTMRVLRDR